MKNRAYTVHLLWNVATAIIGTAAFMTHRTLLFVIMFIAIFGLMGSWHVIWYHHFSNKLDLLLELKYNEEEKKKETKDREEKKKKSHRYVSRRSRVRR